MYELPNPRQRTHADHVDLAHVQGVVGEDASAVILGSDSASASCARRWGCDRRHAFHPRKKLAEQPLDPRVGVPDAAERRQGRRLEQGNRRAVPTSLLSLLPLPPGVVKAAGAANGPNRQVRWCEWRPPEEAIYRREPTPQWMQHGRCLVGAGV